MGMANPEVGEPLDKLSEVFPDGERFYLTGIRIVEANTKDYGKGEMVVVKVRGHDRELGIWGAYLLTQAKSADSGDLNKWYIVERKHIEGFGKGRPVKVFSPAPTPEAVQEALDDDKPDF